VIIWTRPFFYPWFVGFSDGEVCFSAHFIKNHTIICAFRLVLISDEKDILIDIRNKLGVGNISEQVRRAASGRIQVFCTYFVNRTEALIDVIIPIFEQYPLKSKKKAEYKIWKELVLVYKSKAFYREYDKPLNEIYLLMDTLNNLHGKRGRQPTPPSNVEAILFRVRQFRKERENKNKENESFSPEHNPLL